MWPDLTFPPINLWTAPHVKIDYTRKKKAKEEIKLDERVFSSQEARRTRIYNVRKRDG